MSQFITDLILEMPVRRDHFLTEILMGLSRRQKTIHPKYLYDKRGSELFEEITRLKDYYPVHAEREILKRHGIEMSLLMGSDALIIEPGSGAGEKIRLLLPELRNPAGYVPIEISREILLRMTKELGELYPSLKLLPVCADFTAGIDLPVTVDQYRGKKVIFFPGSTIGNFHPDEVLDLLKNFARTVGCGGGLLIGVDLKKDKKLIERAYNDSLGITAQFNLNLLERLNRETGANFEKRQFEHVALYNETEGRLEMHLRSTLPQLVRVNQTIFRFKEGETIHTECSYKYSVEEFCEIAARSRFEVKQVWHDSRHLFCIYYFERN